MTPFTRLAVLALVACAQVQAQYSEERAPRYIASEPKESAPPPVAILKQINRMEDKLNNITTPEYPTKSVFFDHLAKIENLLNEDTLEPMGHNEDGSYTYGYEAADGSFKIETKSPAGEVKGKYGYKDDTGKVRVIEYGANKFGFQPSGEGITVAPPTLVDETKEERQRQENRQQNQQGRRNNQYQPAPAQAIDYDYNDEPQAPQPAPRPAPRPQQQYRPQPAPQQQYRPQPAPQQQYRAPQPTRQQFGVPAPTPAPYRPPQQSPTPPKPQFFAGAAPAPAGDNFFNPEPAPQRRTFQQQPQRQQQQQQAYRPSNPFPDFTDASPSPLQQFNPPDFAPQPPPRRNQNQPYSMLDELLKEYSLPKNGAAPLHDITFGSY